MGDNTTSTPKIAVIGCGPIVNFHLEAARGAGFEVLGVAASLNSSNVDNFAAKYGIPQVWSNPIDLIDSGEWDGLLIAVPTEVTFPLLERALRRNLPILVEKPVAMESTQLLNIASKRLDVMVGYNRRFYPKFQEMRENLISSGPVLISVEIPEKLDASSGKLFAPFSGVRLNSVHVFDLIRFLVGDLEILSIKSIATLNERKGTLAILRGASGHLVSIKLNYQASSNFKIEIDNGSRRYVFLPLEQFEVFDGMKVTEPTQSVPIRSYSPISLVRERSDPTESNYKPGFLGQAHAFKNIIQGDYSSNHATLYDAMKALELAEALTL